MTISDKEKLLIRKMIRNEMNSLNEGFFEDISSLVPADFKASSLIPDVFATSIKKYLFKAFLKKLGLSSTHPLADFIENVVANTSIEDLTKIFITKDIECADIGVIILKAATQTLTTMGLKKVAVPIVHFFAEHSFDSESPNFIKKEEKFKSISSQDVNGMLDSMIGVLGETLISKIVYAFIKESMVPIIQNQICSDETKAYAGATYAAAKQKGVNALNAASTAAGNAYTSAKNYISPPTLTATGVMPEGRDMRKNMNINISIKKSLKYFTNNEKYLIREYYLLMK